MYKPWFIDGLLLGLAIAAPVGPIGVLCIRRSITEGPRVGFICGLGAASADALYAFVGGFALSAVSAWLLRERSELMLAGGVFLLYLGARTWLATPAALSCEARERRAGSACLAFLSTLALTLANPMTILSFAAMFAGIGAPLHGSEDAPGSATGLLVLGVFAGSALWWLALSTLAGRAHRRLGPSALRLLNRLCGLVLSGFGLCCLLRLIARP